jgi:hypothetical protein
MHVFFTQGRSSGTICVACRMFRLSTCGPELVRVRKANAGLGNPISVPMQKLDDIKVFDC